MIQVKIRKESSGTTISLVWPSGAALLWDFVCSPESEEETAILNQAEAVLESVENAMPHIGAGVLHEPED